MSLDHIEAEYKRLQRLTDDELCWEYTKIIMNAEWTPGWEVSPHPELILYEMSRRFATGVLERQKGGGV